MRLIPGQIGGPSREVVRPLARTLEVIDQLPEASAVVLPRTVLPSNNWTVAPAALVPTNTGVVTLVRLSLLELPLSLVAVRSGTDTVGASVSIVTARVPEVV